MTRNEAKELQEAFNHFVNGGILWSYSGTNLVGLNLSQVKGQ